MGHSRRSLPPVTMQDELPQSLACAVRRRGGCRGVTLSVCYSLIQNKLENTSLE